MKFRTLISALLAAVLAVPAAVALVPNDKQIGLPPDGIYVSPTRPPSAATGETREAATSAVFIQSDQGGFQLPPRVGEPGGDRVPPPPGTPGKTVPPVPAGEGATSTTASEPGGDAPTTTSVPVVIEQPTTTAAPAPPVGTTTTTEPAVTTTTAAPSEGWFELVLAPTSNPVAEGNRVTVDARFTDEKTSFAHDIDVGISVSGDVSPSDHSIFTGVSIPAGARSGSLSFYIVDDDIPEGDESLILTGLASRYDAPGVAAATLTLTIPASDGGPPTTTTTAAPVEEAEEDGGLVIPMVWAAISGAPETDSPAAVEIYGNNGTGHHRFYGDLKISWPWYAPVLHRDEGDTLIFPMPRDWATAEAEWIGPPSMHTRDGIPFSWPRKHDRNILLVTGDDLPDLRLRPEGEGSNWDVWLAYLDAHPPVWIDGSGADWSYPECHRGRFWECPRTAAPTIPYRDEWHPTPSAEVIRDVPVGERDIVVHWYRRTGRSGIFLYVADPDGPGPYDTPGASVSISIPYTQWREDSWTGRQLAINEPNRYHWAPDHAFPSASFTNGRLTYKPSEMRVGSHDFKSVTLTEVDAPPEGCSPPEWAGETCAAHRPAGWTKWWKVQANAPAIPAVTTTTTTTTTTAPGG